MGAEPLVGMLHLPDSDVEGFTECQWISAGYKFLNRVIQKYSVGFERRRERREGARSGQRAAAPEGNPVFWIGTDEVEGYVVHMRGRGLSDSSIKNHLSVVRSFFDTLSRRLDLPDPTRRLDEIRFHQKAPKSAFLTRREADVLLGAIEKVSSGHLVHATEEQNADEDIRAAHRTIASGKLWVE